MQRKPEKKLELRTAIGHSSQNSSQNLAVRFLTWWILMESAAAVAALYSTILSYVMQGRKRSSTERNDKI